MRAPWMDGRAALNDGKPQISHRASALPAKKLFYVSISESDSHTGGLWPPLMGKIIRKNWSLKQFIVSALAIAEPTSSFISCVTHIQPTLWQSLHIFSWKENHAFAVIRSALWNLFLPLYMTQVHSSFIVPFCLTPKLPPGVITVGPKRIIFSKPFFLVPYPYILMNMRSS